MNLLERRGELRQGKFVRSRGQTVGAEFSTQTDHRLYNRAILGDGPLCKDDRHRDKIAPWMAV
jgi:hypothetical protein